MFAPFSATFNSSKYSRITLRPTKQYLDDLLVPVGGGYLERSAVLVIPHVQQDSFLAGETLHNPDVAPHSCVVERTELVLVWFVDIRPAAHQSLHHQNSNIVRLAPPADVPLSLVLPVPGGVVERRHLVRAGIVDNDPVVLQEDVDDGQVAVPSGVVQGGVLLLVQPVEVVRGLRELGQVLTEPSCVAVSSQLNNSLRCLGGSRYTTTHPPTHYLHVNFILAVLTSSMWSETPASVFTWCRNKADLETGAFISPDKRDTLEGFLDLTLTLTGSSGSILLESIGRTDPVFISNNYVCIL